MPTDPKLLSKDQSPSNPPSPITSPSDSSLKKINPLIEALTAAGYTGAAGLIFGSITSVIHASPTPRLWTIATSIQWALLGGTYCGIRGVISESQGEGRAAVELEVPAHTTSVDTNTITSTSTNIKTQTQTQSPAESHPYTQNGSIGISAVSGGLAMAAVGAVTRGRANVVPGTIVGVVACGGGQWGLNALREWRVRRAIAARSGEARDERGVIERVMSSRWSPVTRISDEQYGRMIEERIMRVDVEVAMIDDRLNALYASVKEPEKEKGKEIEKAKEKRNI